jgi:hypothetical protein
VRYVPLVLGLAACWTGPVPSTPPHQSVSITPDCVPASEPRELANGETVQLVTCSERRRLPSFATRAYLVQRGTAARVDPLEPMLGFGPGGRDSLELVGQLQGSPIVLLRFQRATDTPRFDAYEEIRVVELMPAPSELFRIVGNEAELESTKDGIIVRTCVRPHVRPRARPPRPNEPPIIPLLSCMDHEHDVHVLVRDGAVVVEDVRAEADEGSDEMPPLP